MDANNITSLLDAGNVTGGILGADNATGTGAADTVSLIDLAIATLGIFVVSWAILCVIMYFIAPYFGRFGDQRSRIVYSAVYSMPFAVIFALGLGGTMSLISRSDFLVSLLVALLIVFALVMLQSFILGVLISKGIIKMQSKRAPQGPVKGKRK